MDADVSGAGTDAAKARRGRWNVGREKDLEGQLALVTGGSSGIGKAVAKQLAGQGADVIVHGRDADRGAAVVDGIIADGGRARFVGADLTRLEELKSLAEQPGQVDVLVNNAGCAWWAYGPTGRSDL
jgi:NAD(P)-dependent dehydrogenase (short-subunit alcohol dehydrogenase family)